MKKMLFILLSVIICFNCFSQTKEYNDKTTVFIASVESKQIVVHNTETGKSLAYPFGKLREFKIYGKRYGSYYSIEPKFILCLYNNKYGVIDIYGNIVEGFKWDKNIFNVEWNEYYIGIYDKKDELVCSFQFDVKKDEKTGEKYLEKTVGKVNERSNYKKLIYE